ncbi:alpha,alpha-trehalose-phosphate synthase (UDP-forming) [Corynebacterium ulceribovis]|uniref:alpha,alpha-trehalose-phosphate synthase (UDP-forming) n=1 Tax=Corynebacterium ulceribovis TaxID=487732 RepID=UPI00035D5C35|nr:trehalose-6-phosphate synthase [Corynebacterium ulceribovis]
MSENTARNQPGEHRRSDLVVVANRLPVDRVNRPDGSAQWVTSPGGLVTALRPVLAGGRGAWVGWPGIADFAADPFISDEGITLYPVELSTAEFTEFYEGFSNATLWPLYHSLIVPPELHNAWWDSYCAVNRRFAEAAAAQAAEGATVWVQDYQLQLVPRMLRELRPDLTIGFFLHIPFPPAEIFRQLPWRTDIVDGLLGADLLGFHLASGAQNFLELVDELGHHSRGVPSVREVTSFVDVADSGRQVGVGAFPISIDTAAVVELAERAQADGKPQRLRDRLGNPDTLLLGVDRLDYTKGILHRLQALEQLLDSGELNPETTVMVQVATPSRERIEHYRQTRLEVEQTVSRINGKFGSVWRPVVHYVHRPMPFAEIVTLYCAADIMLVTALRDGMNLVAKEYVACHSDLSGALVLSEFTGAAHELTEVYLCNPYDRDSMCEAIMTAIDERDHSPNISRDRMSHMFARVNQHDVQLWADSFLAAMDKEG